MTVLRYLAIGGATGIGKSTCELLLAAGHEVVLMDQASPDFTVTQYISRGSLFLNLKPLRSVESSILLSLIKNHCRK